MTPETMSRKVRDLMAAAVVEDDDEKVALLLSDIDNSCERVSDIYAVCISLAMIGREYLRRMHGEENMPDLDEGRALVFQRIPESEGGMADGEPDDPARMFSFNFLAAFVNGGEEAADVLRPLFMTAYGASSEDFARSLCYLVSDVAGWGRAYLMSRLMEPEEDDE